MGEIAPKADRRCASGFAGSDDRLFFANASTVKGRAGGDPRATGPVRSVVFDAEAVTHVDATGLAALVDLRDSLHRADVVLALARAKTPLLERVRESGFMDGRTDSYPTVRAAVEAVKPTPAED